MIRSHNHAQMGGYKLPEALSGSAQAFQCISQYLLKAFRIAVRRSAYIHKLKAEVARGCIADPSRLRAQSLATEPRRVFATRRAILEI